MTDYAKIVNTIRGIVKHECDVAGCEYHPCRAGAWGNKPEVCGKCIYKTYWDAADAIEHLFADWTDEAKSVTELLKAIPRWIPATERLPDDKQNCLCYSKLKSIRVLCFADNLRKIDEYDFADANRPGWFYFDSEWGYCEALEITHWMPLPEPPKEET